MSTYANPKTPPVIAVVGDTIEFHGVAMATIKAGSGSRDEEFRALLSGYDWLALENAMIPDLNTKIESLDAQVHELDDMVRTYDFYVNRFAKSKLLDHLRALGDKLDPVTRGLITELDTLRTLRKDDPNA